MLNYFRKVPKFKSFNDLNFNKDNWHEYVLKNNLLVCRHPLFGHYESVRFSLFNLICLGLYNKKFINVGGLEYSIRYVKKSGCLDFELI